VQNCTDSETACPDAAGSLEV
ncbi:unnamed protein product, partial [Gulo gulo]